MIELHNWNDSTTEIIYLQLKVLSSELNHQWNLTEEHQQSFNLKQLILID